MSKKPSTTFKTFLCLALSAIAIPAFAAKPNLNANNDATGTVGVPFSYQIQATNPPILSYGASPLPAGLSVNATGLISGTPTTAGQTNVTLSARNGDGTTTKVVTFTINPPPTPTPPPHTAPTALAAISPLEVYTGDPVTLDASASHTNPTGSPLTYLWQQVTPASPTISLAPNNKDVMPTFAAPDPGAGLHQAVTFKVKVTDDLASGGDKNTVSDPVTTTVYALPMANAGTDQAIPIRETEVKTVYLNGSGTISRGATTFAWTQTGGPAVTWLTPQDIYNPSFQTTGVAAPGTTLTFNLVVGDGTRVSTPDQVGITLNTVANNVPLANAGADQTVNEQTPVTLNGSATDADNDPLMYTWTQDSGFHVDLTGANTATLTFTAPAVPPGQQYFDLVFKLIANDGFSDSVPSSITVRVLNTNDPPVAVAKAGLTLDTLSEGSVNVNAEDFVILDATSSGDIDGDTLSYSWTELTGSIAIANANTASASFTAPRHVPLGGASYTFKLTVSDSEFTSESYVIVAVGHVNHAPLVDAGPDKDAPARTEVDLDGSNSADEDGDTLTYSWTQIGGTDQVYLTGANTATPSFTAPTVGAAGEDLTFQLTLGDGSLVSTDSVTIHVTYVNRPPVADAGPNQTPDENTVVTLDGLGSMDPDPGNTLEYSWTQIGGPTGIPDVVLSDATVASPTFIAPEVTRFEGDIVMQLTVTDNYGAVSTPATVTIHIHNVNHPPSAAAGDNFSVQWGHPVSLSGSGTDQDVEERPLLTYQWTAPADVTLSGTGANVSFTAPTIPSPMYLGEQVLTFTLRVTDPNGVYSDDSVDVTVTNNGFNPIANAGGSKTVNEHSAVTLNGSGVDPNDDPIHFTWTKITLTAPDLDAPTSATPSFTAPFVDAAGATLTYQLLVWDDFGGWGLDTATITVKNINDPPNIDHAYADPSILWAPDHRLVPVQIKGVTDPDNNATITITKVTQDEPTNGLGDGDTAIDAIISASHDSVQLRAERSGKGDGRVYKVYFTASDFESEALGNSPTGYVKVVVPKSKKTDVAIDSTPTGGYDSTH